ncbi:MAG: MarR family transcriptional regulator [Calothrix sp. SM1_7_51]|nr:MarR family transcriptional regulator [Calothrix sp. SM1_7_51]
MNAGLSGLGLTHVQFVLLAGIVWLSQSRETITQAKLASHAKTDIMMTSKVLRALEKRSLVKRETDARDTRAKSLTVTPEGYNLTIEAMKIVETIDSDFFTSVGEQVGDLNNYLLSILGRGLDNEEDATNETDETDEENNEPLTTNN